MILDWKHIALFGGAILLAGVGLHEYEQSVRADAVAQATKQAQDTYQKQLQGQLSDLQKQMAERDAQYALSLKALDQKFQSAATPSQIAALVSQLMGLKQPIQLVTPQPTPDNPHPAEVAQVSTLDAPQVKAYIQDCETCKLQVPKLQADLADREAQAKIAQQQIDSLKLQRDTALTAAKGGSWLRRTVKAGKYILLGAGAGAAVLCGSGHCKL